MTSSSSLLQSLHYLQRSYSESLQSSCHHRARGFLGERFLNLSSQWTVYKSDAPFKRRVTCIEWHPTHPNAVAFSSKAGDILLWKYDELGRDFTSDPSMLIKGIGYGYGSVSSMKFHPKNPNCMYTTSIDGTFRLQDFTGKHSNVFLDTQNYRFWWVSFDYCLDYNLLFVGDSRGKGVLLSTDGKVIKEFKKLHKGKIKHAQFCHAQSNILTTASLDRTVQIWDVRMLREDQEISVKPLSTLKHNAPVSSSHFDPLSGTRLLTTSQNGELRVYDSFNMWTEPTVTIEHAHKHFQHLTDITATWHPLYDNVCVVGRYPRTSADKQIRGVDLISLDSGEKAGHIYSPHVTGIMSVNKFNRTGEVLASGEGCRVLVWKLPVGLEFKRKAVNGSDSTSVPGLSGEAIAGARKKRKREPDKDDTAVKKLKQKMACEAVTVTTTRKRKK